MKIWVDIENAPQVLVLYPIIQELEAQGHAVEITSRDFGQTLSLLELHRLKHQVVGRHAGKNKLKKVLAFTLRSVQLWQFAKRQHFNLALCHGARGIVFPSYLLGIPSVVLFDYEHAFTYLFRRWAYRILMPEVISDNELQQLGFDSSRVIKYPGLKEELYVYNFEPDPAVLTEIGIDPDKVIVVMRPPATMAHYHVAESEQLFWNVLYFLIKRSHVQIILLPRTSTQAEEIRNRLSSSNNVIIPKKVVYGPNLLWFADLMIGGGGTMNREAACLGIPTYSIFRGRLGAVDRYLIQQGRLILLSNAQEVEQIRLEKHLKPKLAYQKERSQNLTRYIVSKILETIKES